MKYILFLLVLNVFSQDQEALLKVEKVYTVKENDNLWNIAGKFYKDNYKWKKIYENNIQNIENPNLIYPNMTLTIPEIYEDIPTPIVDVVEEKVIIKEEPKIEKVEKLEENNKEEIKIYDKDDLSEKMPKNLSSSSITSNILEMNKNNFLGEIISREGKDKFLNDGLFQIGDKLNVSFEDESYVLIGKIYKIYLIVEQKKDNIKVQETGECILRKEENKDFYCEITKISGLIEKGMLLR